MWIALGLAFSVFVYFGYENQWLGMGAQIDAVDGAINGGRAAAIKYLTGYVVEKSLSVDNIFVIMMIFGRSGNLPAPGAVLGHPGGIGDAGGDDRGGDGADRAVSLGALCR